MSSKFQPIDRLIAILDADVDYVLGMDEETINCELKTQGYDPDNIAQSVLSYVSDAISSDDVSMTDASPVLNDEEVALKNKIDAIECTKENKSESTRGAIDEQISRIANSCVPPSSNEFKDLLPRVSVWGVGGAGGNAVNNMIEASIDGVDFVVANTDAQSLRFSKSSKCIQLGVSYTQGLGAGSKPEIGRTAAEETIDEINEQIKGSHMVFIVAGMGGGTGTGAAPVIARAARDLGVLTVGVVTKPFQFEGQRRQRIADKGIEDLEQYVDTLIVIPNQNLFRVANEKTTFADAFKMADDVLYSGVRGITDLMVMPGLINLDFADVRSVMSEMGKAMMGTGEAKGEHRALDAAEAAISNPLLDDISMAAASGVLINITGGPDMTLYEVDEAANRIRSEVDDDAYIIFGSTYDDSMEDEMRVSIVATGIGAEAVAQVLNQTMSNPVGEAKVEQISADLLAEDALMNGMGAEEMLEKREGMASPSLFARVTGGAMNKVTSFDPKSAPAQAPTPQVEDSPVGAREEAATPEAIPVMRSQSSVRLEPTLGGLEPEERLQPSQPEAGLLNIPMFLRRQDN